MCESLEQKEHKRWLAHKDAAVSAAPRRRAAHAIGRSTLCCRRCGPLSIRRPRTVGAPQVHAAFPTEFTLNGVAIPVYKMPELEALGAKRLKERAMNLRDRINAAKCNLFGHHPHLALNVYASPDVLLKWMIDVQVTIAEAIGEGDGAGNLLDHAAFGAPEFAAEHPAQSHQQQLQQQQQQYAEWHHAQQSGERLRSKRLRLSCLSPPCPPLHLLAARSPRSLADVRALARVCFSKCGVAPPAPCWSQAGINDGQTPMRQPPQQNEYARPVFPWSQHALVDEQPLSQRTPGQWKQGPPRHEGFSLVPPHLSNDAAMIRNRGHSSSVVLG